MAALGGGLVALVLGIIGIIIWWGFFIKALLAAVPAMLILGGALAVYLGVEELRDKRRADSFDDTTSTLKSEVDGLKDEIKELKKEKGEEEKAET
ncbi:MAG: hypothetical protein HQ561_13715 [Desulfobacteraceae bacterium]|nr:hypothetical protein [Desulfobacteraceae bacterium]